MKLCCLAGTWAVLLSVGIGSVGLAVAVAAELPSLESAALARGQFSSMRMLLEKTFLNIDVALIDVRVGKRVQAEFSKLASGQTYSEALEAQLAGAALRADEAVIQLEFLRDVSLERWVDGVRHSLEKAQRAGLISTELQRRVSAGLPQWFQALEADGFQRGDRLFYDLRPAVLRSVVVTRAGQVRVDRTDKGEDIPRVVLASYFAPGTDYRRPLLKSLLAPAAGRR